MTKTYTKKVCIVVSSLGIGGAERSSALLSEMLYDLDYDVHIISVLDEIDYDYKGKLLNLGKLKTKDDSKIGRLKRLRIFKNYLKNNNFDYIIDNRTRRGYFKELIISKWVYNAKKTIYCVHSFYTESYIYPNIFLARILYASAYKIVPVSNGISKKLKSDFGFKNFQVIHNLVDVGLENISSDTLIKDDYVLFYGRLTDRIKNISLLIDAYSKSKLPGANMKLKILGDGEDRVVLNKKSIALGLDKYIEFLEFRPNPYEIVKAAYFTLLTSRYEGLPMVLVESLALGTPVVSVDCKSGPNEIIINEQNGLLVENHNVEALTNAMNRLLEDKDLYLHCKSNAKKSVAKFSKDVIGKQWKALLK
jgi:glycosyltransferase involved in cell wall biosynthesis